MSDYDKRVMEAVGAAIERAILAGFAPAPVGWVVETSGSRKPILTPDQIAGREHFWENKNWALASAIPATAKGPAR